MFKRYLAAVFLAASCKNTVLSQDIEDILNSWGRYNLVTQFNNKSGFAILEMSEFSMPLEHRDLFQKNEPLDFAISSNGFYQIQVPTGQTAYTRVSNFIIDGQTKQVTMLKGYPLIPNITVPDNMDKFVVSSDGVVQVRIQGATTSYQQLGQIQLATFPNPSGLKAIGDFIFLETPASGIADVGHPNTGNKGSIIQAWYESSNVDIVEKIVVPGDP